MNNRSGDSDQVAGTSRSDLLAKTNSLLETAKSLEQLTRDFSGMNARERSSDAQSEMVPPASPSLNPGVAEKTDMPAQHSKDPAARFYANLESNGQLVDVDESTDLAALSPRITHIRYPDGRIERIGFS